MLCVCVSVNSSLVHVVNHYGYVIQTGGLKRTEIFANFAVFLF